MMSAAYEQASFIPGATSTRGLAQGAATEIITYACRELSLGLMAMAATDRGVCFLQFGDNEPSLVDDLKAAFPKAELHPFPAPNAPELDTWLEALDQHITQGFSKPDIPLDLQGTTFQIEVWEQLLNLAEGKVISYSELAAKVGKPKAVRAVASACAKNRIAILVPCHRVMRRDGGPGGYRWGLERKRTLLTAERQRLIS